MYYGKVELAGINTAELTVLCEKDKEELMDRTKKGDVKARDELISGNIRLVLSVIQRFMSRGENPDDLFQVGCIGLIKAIDGFDNTRGVRLSTYAVPMIIGEVRRYLRDNNSVRISRSIRDIAYRAMQAKEQFIKTNGREPTITELADVLHMEKENVVFALEAISEPVSLYETVYSDGEDSVCVLDQIRCGEDDSDWVEKIQFRDNMHTLEERENKIIYLRYMKGLTQTQVAKIIGLSQAQVSRLEKNAMEKIKH